MPDFEPGQIGKYLIFGGLVVTAAGVLVTGLSKLGLFRLPGDIDVSGRHWRVFLPVASCLVLSVILTLIMWIVHYFMQK